MSIQRLHLRSRSALLLGIAALLTTGLMSPPALAADPAPAPANPALLTGPFNLAKFGAVSGLPLACSLGLSTVELASTEVLGPVAGVVSQAIAQLSDACTTIAAQGVTALEAAQPQFAPLAPVLNPVVNPLFEGLASGVEDAAPLYRSVLAPADVTVFDLGDSLRYFLGF